MTRLCHSKNYEADPRGRETPCNGLRNSAPRRC